MFYGAVQNELLFGGNSLDSFYEGELSGAAAPEPPRRLGVSPVGLSPVGLARCFYANIYVFAKMFFVR